MDVSILWKGWWCILVQYSLLCSIWIRRDDLSVSVPRVDWFIFNLFSMKDGGRNWCFFHVYERGGVNEFAYLDVYGFCSVAVSKYLSLQKGINTVSCRGVRCGGMRESKCKSIYSSLCFSLHTIPLYHLTQIFYPQNVHRPSQPPSVPPSVPVEWTNWCNSPPVRY